MDAEHVPTSQGGLEINSLDQLGRQLGNRLNPGSSRWLIGFQNLAAVERFEEWIRKLPLDGGQTMEVFVLNRSRLPIRPNNQGLHISFDGAVTVPTNRAVVLLVHDFGWLHKNDQRNLRHLVDGEGDADKSLAEGSLLIGTFIQGQHGWIDPGFGGARCVITDA